MTSARLSKRQSLKTVFFFITSLTLTITLYELQFLITFEFSNCNIFVARPIHSANPRYQPPSWIILDLPLCFIQRPARYSYLINGILHSLQGNTVFIKETTAALKIWHLDGSSGKTAIIRMTVMEHFQVVFTGNSQRFTSVVEQTEIKTFLFFFLLIFHFFCWLTIQRNARWLSGQWLVWSGYIIIHIIRRKIKQMVHILTMLEKYTLPFITVTTRVRKHKLVRIFLLTSWTLKRKKVMLVT